MPTTNDSGMKKKVHVNFSCRVVHDCDCMEKDNKDPEEVGYPPYHDGCHCYVVLTGKSTDASI